MRTGLLTASAVAVIVAVSGLLLAGGSGPPSPSSSQSSGTSAKANTVDIKDFKYKPQMVEVQAGTKVSFTNEDTAKHTATSKPQGAFDSGDLNKGQTKPVAFKKPGTFQYYCVYHAFMTGTVKVVK
ncbi:MAG: cupredoxin domain-containing protein [Thermoleophilaceae bacterium]